MRLILVLILSFYCSYANNAYIDNITFSKIKKLVKKEEQIAYAYKKFIKEQGSAPSLSILINNNYLPDGFSTINLFGRQITISTATNRIVDVLPDEITVKPNVHDYYYSNDNRVYTRAPFSDKNNNVNIVLNTQERYILRYQDDITKDKSSAKDKYYLDDQGVLHWYDALGNYKFTLGKDLITDSSLGKPGTSGFANFFKNLDKEVQYAGQTTFAIESTEVEEYLNLGEEAGYVKVGDDERNTGETIIQFTRRAGGMIVNGDIYTWGNNANRITSINKDKYYNSSGNVGSRYPVISGLVRAKAKVYDDDSRDGVDYSVIHSKKYYSSPLRPKFIDFFSTVYHSTCGISTKGELYCGGSTGGGYSFGNNFTHTDYESGKELLYRNHFFNGISNKASKIFANNQIWLILGQNGRIYRWGFDWSGFSGNGEKTFNYYGMNRNKNPEPLNITDGGTQVKFKDISYLLTIGYRKMGALSSTGDIYIWGVESQIADGNCNVRWQGQSMNLCKPLKVESPTIIKEGKEVPVSFESFKGGLEAFVALGEGKYYKIHQPKYHKPQVILIDDLIKVYNDSNDNKYIEEDDAEIIAVDLSSKLVGSTLVKNEGIVWINGKNQLKGDYFTSKNKNDEFFKAAIKKIKWKDIKVIEDDNGMCGIDIYNQMYCWGIMSYYRNGSGLWNEVGNTFMLPVFNTNLYDLNKDYMVVEGGNSGHLTNMTSGDWSTTNSVGKTGAFFMKYPTYIGGFNYEFIFK